jgi:hypothetical protein
MSVSYSDFKDGVVTLHASTYEWSRHYATELMGRMTERGKRRLREQLVRQRQWRKSLAARTTRPWPDRPGLWE